jgi:hypothetical protein
MATQSNPRPRRSWRDSLLEILGVTLPIVLGALLDPRERTPEIISVKSLDGVGQLEVVSPSRPWGTDPLKAHRELSENQE